MTAGLGPRRRRNPLGKPLAQGRLRLFACRVFVALAALSFVVAFSIAALAPLGLTLEGGMRRLGWMSLAALPHGAAGGWHGLASAFLARPAWMVPVMLGVVSGGLAVTFGRSPRGRPPGLGRRG